MLSWNPLTSVVGKLKIVKIVIQRDIQTFQKVFWTLSMEMKASVTYCLLLSDELHCVPIGQMGNYQEYLKKLHSESPPLRQLENTPTRVHMFGNPFKVNKVQFFMLLH